MQQYPFPEKELTLGKQCVSQGGVVFLQFSRGTYQAEIVDKNQVFWPFLQINEEGKILDALCSCSIPFPCMHVAALYIALFAGKAEPLHKRFKHSFWHQICLCASRKYGYRADRLLRGERWEARSLAEEVLFWIRPLQKKGKDKLKLFFEGRSVETEETSLKFSLLQEEEISLWRQGRPSDKLKYELSFWADVAKWFLEEQEEGTPYQITFFPDESLPTEVRICFPFIECGFAITKEDWPSLIPSLKTVQCPLSVHEAAERSIQSIQYDAKNKQFLLKLFAEEQKKGTPGLSQGSKRLGPWLFVPKEGFFHEELDPLFSSDRIQGDTVGFFLSKYASCIREYLAEPIHEGTYQPQYEVFFDKENALHMTLFLFTQGDLSGPMGALFGRWAYLPSKGFFYLHPLTFPSIETVFPSEEVGDCIEKHKVWFNERDGFNTHLMSVESNLSFTVSKEGELLFTARIDLQEEGLEIRDIGNWIFIATKGFFPKQKEKLFPFIHTGEKIAKDEVSFFLHRHQRELAYFPGFFTKSCPVDGFFLDVYLEREKIHIQPRFTLHLAYREKEILFYRDYVYVKGEGFSWISFLPPLLQNYVEEKILQGKEEAFFLSHLKEIRPWISHMDPQLVVPQTISLVLKGMEQKGNSPEWLLELSYKTEYGEVNAHEIWKGLQQGRGILFSPGGMLDLSQDRFRWLKQVAEKKWKQEGKKLRLNALEWIRLQAWEEVSLSAEAEEKEGETRQAFESFRSFQGYLPLDITLLQSELRPYQETGVTWLWFLYSYGLSGLLCDEMGLGKTHQAMALMASAAKRGGGKKFLVVCPTSVIYHWEGLLHRFLPELKVRVFHGQGRRGSGLEEDYAILLTSYGIIRTEKEKLSKVLFDIVIYDEIQQAKNARSQTHKALKSLSARMSVGLTGTPIENRVMELKALLDLVLPHYLPSDAQFKEHFVLPIEKEQDKDKKQLLMKLIQPFILRRKKADVLLELPDKTEEIAYCDLSQEQATLYHETYQAYKDQVYLEVKQGKEQGVRMHIFALFSKLKQVCDHPSLLRGDPFCFQEHTSGKWDLFLELLAEARESNQKVVVFTQYLHMMDIIKLHLSSQGIGFAEIRGSTKDRKGALERFQTDPKCEVFVASLQAAGVGIELTAASIVIHYDRWWNPARENQATDRVHRMGQNRGVQVFKLVSKDTIEEKIHELILKKKDLLEEVIGFDEQDVIKKLTQEEIFALFASLERNPP